MMYVISKVVGFLINPYNLLVICGLVLGLSALWRSAASGWIWGLFKVAQRCALGFLIFVASMYVIPWGGWIVASLERWEVSSDLPAGQAVDGTIVLGGAVNGRVSVARKRLELSEHGDRVLALLHALATTPGPVIYTGANEAGFAQESLAPLLTPQRLERLKIEPDALTTAEHPWRIAQAGIGFDNTKVYGLVTSAFHMPRAVAVFQKAGVKVHPVPVDFLSPRRTRVRWNPRLRYQLDMLRLGTKEYIGLLGYWVAGRL